MTISTRDAALPDVPKITAIYADCVLNGIASYEIAPPDEAEMSRRFATITRDGYRYIVAEKDGIFLGYAYAAAFRTRAAYRFLVEDSIYLAPEARGMGVGKVLLAELVRRCTALGFRQMVAVIGGPHPASIALHRSAGFEHGGLVKGSGFKHGQWLDTVIMQLALGEGAETEPPQGMYPDTLHHNP
jgi:L-amino acid N-acyltransferase YncA